MRKACGKEAITMTDCIQHFLIPQPDGSFIDWGRNATINGVRGFGPARYYGGEAAEVLRVLLRYSGKESRK
ncbi:hypothetical protein [Fimbriiglobus ruber]|uniref:hypothetical protein n=1 Tax=Fimbriiglobus ruber TaxID=1908690 RepID=UPI001EE73A2F|nr:hypothetical protein [Fimbriiglobus ruber]